MYRGKESSGLHISPADSLVSVTFDKNLQGGLFTAIVDHKPTDTQFNVPPGLTQVKRPP